MTAPKKTLTSNLEARLKKRFDDKIPQSNMLARLFNLRCDEGCVVTEETLQTWLDGTAEPSELQLKTLQAWLGP